MKNYEKPEITVVEESCEGVYAASGEVRTCRFGRTEAGRGVDTCQSCSATNGENGTGVNFETGKQYYEADYVGCPDGMPEK